MTAEREVYKCGSCGAIVAVLKGGAGELKCCETRMVEVTPDEARKMTFDMPRPGAP